MKINTIWTLVLFHFFSVGAHGNGPDCGVTCEIFANLILPPHGAAHLVSALALAQKQEIIADLKTLKFPDFHFEADKKCQGQMLTVSEWSDSLKKCLTLPGFPPDQGFNFSEKTKSVPVMGSLEKFQISDFDFEILPPEPCSQAPCPLKVKITKLNLEARWNLNAKNGGRQFIAGAPITISSNASGNPVADIQTKISLPTAGTAGQPSFIPPRNTNVQVHPETLRVALKKTIMTPSLRSSIQESQERSLEKMLRNPKWAETAFNLALFTKTNSLRAEYPRDSAGTLRARAEAALAQEKITLQTLQNLTPEELNRNKSHWLNSIPAIQYAADEGLMNALAKDAGFKDTAVYKTAKLGDGIISQALSEFMRSPGMRRTLEELSQDLAREIEESINSTLQSKIQNLNQLNIFPDINLQDLGEAERFKREQELLQRKADRGENIEASKADFLQRLQEFQKKSNSKWFPMDVKALFAQAEIARDISTLSIMDNSKPCLGSGPSPSLDPATAPPSDKKWDLAIEMTVPGINKYLEELQKRGSLNLCIGDDNPLECKSGTRVKLSEPPHIRWQAPDYVVTFKNDVGPYGQLNTEVHAQLKTCKGYPCLELKKVNSESKSAFLWLAGAGPWVEHMIQEKVSTQGTLVPTKFSGTELVHLRPNPDSGALMSFFKIP